ncbi:MAG: hypothetical protein HOV81_13500 [Kofleriaceae bacterium]|nr:hypothetical protein [Kofleriaceae bacterium]
MRRLALATTLFIFACGPADRETPTDAAGSAGSDSGSGSGSDAQQPMPPASRIYAHSGATLYKIDAGLYTPTMVGDMKLNGTPLNQSITDIAIDNNDRMIGITLDKLYTINEMTGAVTLITNLPANAQGFQSLSFVPDPADDTKDILIAANFDGDVYKIDQINGSATKIGSYGTVTAGKVGSSGDIISVRGFGTGHYATVKIAGQPFDFLAQIDKTTYAASPIGQLGAGTGFKDIFGLAYWEGTIFGFVAGANNTGKIIKIDPTTGVGTEVQSGAIRWFGAGVATDAPILQ